MKKYSFIVALILIIHITFSLTCSATEKNPSLEKTISFLEKYINKHAGYYFGILPEVVEVKYKIAVSKKGSNPEVSITKTHITTTNWTNKEEHMEKFIFRFSDINPKRHDFEEDDEVSGEEDEVLGKIVSLIFYAKNSKDYIKYIQRSSYDPDPLEQSIDEFYLEFRPEDKDIAKRVAKAMMHAIKISQIEEAF